VRQNTKLAVPLSARTVEQLKQKTRDLRDYVSRRGPSIDLMEIAYTLQVGRRQWMREWDGWWVHWRNWRKSWEAYIEEKPGIEGFYEG
jgi:acyl transferase domain-containing protein